MFPLPLPEGPGENGSLCGAKDVQMSAGRWEFTREKDPYSAKGENSNFGDILSIGELTMGGSTIHDGRQSAATPGLPVGTEIQPTSSEGDEEVSSSCVEAPALISSCQNPQEKPPSEPGGGEPLPGRRARTWPQKFRDAFRGIALGIWGQNSFLVHGFFTIAALVAGAVFQISLIEWLIVLLCIVTVWTAEMFNSALERLARAVNLKYDPHIRDALDIGSGAVLVAAIGAASIGGILFLFHFFKLVGVL